MSLNRGQSLSKLLNEAAAVFMHRPFHKMPMNAFSISYLYALANGDEDDHQEFYDLLDQANIDILLVGDSASNVMAGHETTLPITLDEMIYHAKSVVRGINRCLVVVDLPLSLIHI